MHVLSKTENDVYQRRWGAIVEKSLSHCNLDHRQTMIYAIRSIEDAAHTLLPFLKYDRKACTGYASSSTIVYSNELSAYKPKMSRSVKMIQRYPSIICKDVRTTFSGLYVSGCYYLTILLATKKTLLYFLVLLKPTSLECFKIVAVLPAR